MISLDGYIKRGDRFIGRGRVLRIPFQLYDEGWRDLMVYECRKKGFGMGLLIVSGHHSGTPVVYLPEVSMGGHEGVISAVWLRNNFAEYVYECSADKIYVLERPLPPAII